MQDNRWDDQFTDHAWAEMRKLLDREMPVRGAWIIRRRWMSVAAAVLLLLLAAGGAYWRGPAPGGPMAGQRQLPSATEAESAPVRKEPASTAAMAETSQMDPTADAPRESSTLGNTPSNPFREQMTAPFGEQALAEVPDSNHPTTADSPGTSTGEDPAGVASAGERASEPSAIALREPSPSGAAAAAGVPPSAKGDAAFVSPLPSRAVALNAPVAGVGLPAAPLAETSDPASATSSGLLPDRWGLQGSTVAGGSGLTGLAAGLAADYRLGESRWSVQTGARYMYQNRDFAFQAPGGPGSQSITTEDNRNPNNDTLSTSGPQRQAFNPQSFPVAAVTHSINLPLAISYRLSDRLGLQMGVQMTYALVTQRTNSSSALQSSGSFTANGLASTDTKTFQLVSTPSDNTFQPNLLQRWDVGLTGGLQFQAMPRLALQMRYNFGLADLVRSPYYASYNRFFSLGAIYYLD